MREWLRGTRGVQEGCVLRCVFAGPQTWACDVACDIACDNILHRLERGIGTHLTLTCHFSPLLPPWVGPQASRPGVLGSIPGRCNLGFLVLIFVPILFVCD